MAKKQNQEEITQEGITQEETGLATISDMPGLLAGNAADLFNSQIMAMWSSIPREQPALILKASQDSDHNMMDYFDENPGAFILAKHVLIHNVQIADEETGELVTQTRTVIIDTNGVTYSSVSAGVLGSLQKIFALFGMPEWTDGLKLTARRVKTRKYKTINLTVVD